MVYVNFVFLKLLVLLISIDNAKYLFVVVVLSLHLLSGNLFKEEGVEGQQSDRA